MRVLMFDASDRGGIATYTDRLADALELAGADVHLAAPASRARNAPVLEPHAWGERAPRFRRAGLYGRRLREAVRGAATFVRALRAVRPDVVHVQTRVAPRLDPLLFRLARRRVPIIVTVHDVEPLEGGTRAFAQQARTWRAADGVIVHGSRVHDLVARAAPGCRVVVAPADVPPTLHVVEKTEARARLGVPLDQPVALLFGLLRAYKGIELLDRAWPRVRARAPGAWLYVVGSTDGFDVPELDRLREHDGVVVREGFVPEADVDAWLAAADVLVVAYTKGVHSAVLRRAAVNGTPALASPALAEEVENAAAGRVVPLDPEAWADAIVAALGQEPLPRPPRPTGGRLVAATLALYDEMRARRH